MATGPTAVLTLRRLGWPGSNAVWVQRWDGIGWSGFSAPSTLPSWLQYVRSLLAMPDGGFLMRGAARPPVFLGSVALLRWNGSSPDPQGNLETSALARDPVSGHVFAAGGAFSIRRFNSETTGPSGRAAVAAKQPTESLVDDHVAAAGRSGTRRQEPIAEALMCVLSGKCAERVCGVAMSTWHGELYGFHR